MSSRDAYLRRKYGITEQEYEELERFQGGMCWICGYRPGVGKRRLSVDHDHKTGNVRGLLCHKCNRGLVWFRDSHDNLRRAALYVSLPPWEMMKTTGGKDE